jgi:SAM-dependent methyltransferase
MQKIYDQGAQSRAVHAAYNFTQIYPHRMLSEIPKQGVVMDIGTGVGRDAVEMHDRANGRLLVIGIDPDEANYAAAVQTYPHKDIVLCRDWDDVAGVKRNRQIAYLVTEVQNITPPPARLRADFINCSAVLMFIPQDEQPDFMGKMHDLVKPYHNVFLRHRTDMLKDGMTKIDMKILYNDCYQASFAIDKLPDFPDSKRDFSWHDHVLTAICKPNQI